MGKKIGTYTGVTFNTNRNKWQARYYDRSCGTQHYIGLFESECDAAAAVVRYKEALGERRRKHEAEVSNRLKHDAKLIRNMSSGDRLLFDI